MNSNDKTLTSYNHHVQEYIDGTPQQASGVVKDWIDQTLSLLPPGGRVLELGSAFGRDATYMEAKGFRVERTDAAVSFVDLLEAEGHEARVLNAITDELGDDFDLIFANAVFLHLTPTEFERTLIKCLNALKPGGVLAFTLKQGKGEEWSEAKLNAPRYFCYWTSERLTELLGQTGFKIVSMEGDKKTKNADWLQVIALN